MSQLFERILSLGTKVAKACGSGLRAVVKPAVSLVLWAARKGNRFAMRLVHCVRRFLYIARRYGYKRAFRLTAYRLEQLMQRCRPVMKHSVVRLAPMLLVTVLLAVAIQSWTDFTLAYEVSYNGNSVGYVASEAVFEDACQLVSDRVVEDEFSAGQVSYSLKVVSADAVNDVDELYENIVEADQQIQVAVGLYVDGTLVAVCPDGEQIKSAMGQVIDSYAKNKGEETLSFANEIEYIGGLYPADLVSNTLSVEQLADVLTVVTTARETYAETIPFKTVEQEDASRYIGYREVKNQGKNGKKQLVADVSYINGKEVERTVLSETVTKEAVDKVVVVGTKRYSPSAMTTDDSHLLWPVEGTDVSDVSSFWGDGRNHKGTDILAPNGTAIFAAEAGTVTYVGWESGWGLYMTIDHGNGLKTLYAHCSSITAKQGQKVERGEYIAAVGITGNAYGYHLHFEVYQNGVAVDGRPYLGVN